MLFVATCTDKPNAVALRADTRPAHLAYLERLGARIRAGGALLSPDQTGAVGSLLILEGDSEAEIAALLADDPYLKAGLFAHVDIKPWRQAVGAPLA